MMPMVLGGSAAVIVIGAIVLLAAGGSSSQTVSATNTRTNAAVATGTSSKRSLAPAPTPAPSSHTATVETPSAKPAPTDRHVPEAVAIPASSENPLEREAQAAWDELQRGPAAPEARIKALEAFVEKYDRAIISARANLQLRELRAAQEKPSEPPPAAPVAADSAKTEHVPAATPVGNDTPKPSTVTAPVDDVDPTSSKAQSPRTPTPPVGPVASAKEPAAAASNAAQAKAALARLNSLAEARDRAGLAEALRNFRRNFGATELAAQNQAALKTFELKSAPILLSDGLVVYFPLNDGTGTTAADATANIRDIQLKNCAWSSNALDCNGANSWAPIAPLPVQTNALTLCAWVNHRENTGRYERYVTVTGDNAIIRRNKDTKLEFVLRINGKFECITSNDALENNRWFFVAGTWDGKTMRLYRDGTQVSSATHPGKVPPCNDGTLSWAEEAMSGLLGDVRIYNRALSDAELQQLADPKSRAAGER